MGRIDTIESTAASGLPHYNNLKVIVRGRPRYLDPQLDGGTLRFAVRRGFNFSGIIPDNQSEIGEDANKYDTVVTLAARPSWMTMGTLVRIGNSEAIGELHHILDTIDVDAIELTEPLTSAYSASRDQDIIPVVSLIGSPCTVYAPIGAPDDARIMQMESWYQVVPGDVILMSLTPDVLESLEEYTVKRADYFDTRAGLPGTGEPATIYRYQIEFDTKTGLLPFVPEVGLALYLKALPLFIRGGWGEGDVDIPADAGPCLLDAFFGSLLNINKTETVLGIRTWDSFGGQVNAAETGNQEWQKVTKNHLLRERAISSDSLLFWQRITGNFQYQKNGYFIAELTDEGKFTFSTDLLVPKWPTDREYGWVIPLVSRSDVRVIVQFEPQEQQIFDVPANELTFIRPHILADPEGVPIDRLIISFLGSPNSKVEIREWQYDGSAVTSISYYILGTGEAYGLKRWLAGGFSAKPLFYNFTVLRARYSDGVSRYNAGHTYV
jgi:hypothetical protein